MAEVLVVATAVFTNGIVVQVTHWVVPATVVAEDDHIVVADCAAVGTSKHRLDTHIIYIFFR